jgi:hypothetical protein
MYPSHAHQILMTPSRLTSFIAIAFNLGGSSKITLTPTSSAQLCSYRSTWHRMHFSVRFQHTALDRAHMPDSFCSGAPNIYGKHYSLSRLMAWVVIPIEMDKWHLHEMSTFSPPLLLSPSFSLLNNRSHSSAYLIPSVV